MARIPALSDAPISACPPLRRHVTEDILADGRLKPKQIVVAAMRKLLVLCFGVLKTGKPFDPAIAMPARRSSIRKNRLVELAYIG